jgi:two-component system sensor histidine kinase YesM
MKNFANKFPDVRKSIIGKVITLFIMVFILLLTPIVVQSITSFGQARAHRDIINAIINVNQLNTDVSENVAPITWNISAGKVSFEESEILNLMVDFRERMVDIRDNTDSSEDWTHMETTLRALTTLENYLLMLQTQIEERYPVDENEILLEEIRICVAGINDLLLEFSTRQVNEAAELNQIIARSSTQNFVVNLSLIGIVFIVCWFTFWYISRSLQTPIKKLLNMSNRISEGDFSLRVSLSASDEFNDLAEGMNIMSEKIELLLEQSIAEQKQIQMLEYKVMQAQVSPHFLYNTLDAIIWAAEANNREEVLTLVTSLSSFFRISLSRGVDFIPISDEVEYLRSYLIIQQIRHHDVLSYEIHVDDDITHYKIPKLLLQPLVENALYHGIKNTRKEGKIIVSIRKEDSKIRFTVSDDGIGMTPETLKALKEGLVSGSGEKGYGLFNVSKRLELYYGMYDGLQIESKYEEGTKVSFVLDTGGEIV